MQGLVPSALGLEGVQLAFRGAAAALQDPLHLVDEPRRGRGVKHPVERREAALDVDEGHVEATYPRRLRVEAVVLLYVYIYIYT